MTSIWIDPSELQQASALLQTLAEQVATLADDLVASCCCSMPSTIAGYVGAELDSARIGVQGSSEMYGIAADELSLRASLVATDQSMITAASSAFGGPAATASAGSDWLAGMSNTGATSADTAPVPGDWLSGMESNAGSTWTNPGFEPWTAALSQAQTTASESGDLPYSWTMPVASAGSHPGLVTIGGVAGPGAGMTGYNLSSGNNVQSATTLGLAGISAQSTNGNISFVDPSGNSSSNIATARRDPNGGNYHF